MARGRGEGKNGTPGRADASISTQQRSIRKEEGEESGGGCNGRPQAANRNNKGGGRHAGRRGSQGGDTEPSQENMDGLLQAVTEAISQA